MKALYFEQFGGPDVLRYGELPDPELPSGHALVRTRAIGLNFADIYRRRGNYHLAGSPPYVAGYEAAGVIEQIHGETPFQVGDRVGFADSPFANAALVAVPFEKLIPLPDHISFESAATVLLQGLTAQFLVTDSYHVKSGKHIAVHAASGGVGSILVQLLKARGAHVIAIVSSAEKAERARRLGADQVAVGDEWKAIAKDTDAIYDSIGNTLHESIATVRTGGTVIFYGMAGGDPRPIDPRVLMDGSKTLVGGDLWNVLTTAESRVTRSKQLFDAIADGKLRVEIDRTFALSDGANAHRYLESRAAQGKVLLIPD